MGRLEALLIGRRIDGRYRVEAILGRGGMGVVYRAVDERLDRQIALKVLSPPGDVDAGSHNLRARFRREARAAAAIRHPNVVGVHDYGTDPELDLDYLVMELLEGDDLANLLSKSARRDLETTVAVLQGAAAGLAAGHRLGIVHRDVKPANVFLANEGGGPSAVRLLDFGIAQAWGSRPETLTRLTEFGQVPLTPAFAAPEQARGGVELTPAADVYSLGMTALAMLSPEAPRNRMLEGGSTPIRLSGSPLAPALERVLARALHPDPGQRFADGAAFAEALGALRATGAPPAQAPAPALEPTALAAPVGTRGRPARPVVRQASAARRRRLRGRTPVGVIVGAAAGTIVSAAVLLSVWKAPGEEGEPRSFTDSITRERFVPAPPSRPWPSLTAEEEQAVEARRRAGMDEREAVLRLAAEALTGCELGGSAAACARRAEIEALLLDRGLVRVPGAAEQQRAVDEGMSLVQQIQDARIGMGIVHPTLYDSSGGSLERYPARVFVRDGNAYKAVADIRFRDPVFETERIVEEFYYDSGGQLVYVRRRSWAASAEPVAHESYHFRGGVLVNASANGEISPLTGTMLQLDALLVHRRGEAIHRGVQSGHSKVYLSLGDLYPAAE